MSMLHTVNKSPFERNSLESCLRLAVEGSAIILIEDAVVGAIRGTNVSEKLEAAAKGHAVYVLGPDLAARGLDESRLIDGVKVVGYDGFVDLAVEHDAVHAWL